jgi:hypothetical protein
MLLCKFYRSSSKLIIIAATKIQEVERINTSKITGFVPVKIRAVSIKTSQKLYFE